MGTNNSVYGSYEAHNLCEAGVVSTEGGCGFTYEDNRNPPLSRPRYLVPDNFGSGATFLKMRVHNGGDAPMLPFFARVNEGGVQRSLITKVYLRGSYVGEEINYEVSILGDAATPETVITTTKTTTYVERTYSWDATTGRFEHTQIRREVYAWSSSSGHSTTNDTGWHIDSMGTFPEGYQDVYNRQLSSGYEISTVESETSLFRESYRSGDHGSYSKYTGRYTLSEGIGGSAQGLIDAFENLSGGVSFRDYYSTGGDTNNVDAECFDSQGNLISAKLNALNLSRGVLITVFEPFIEDGDWHVRLPTRITGVFLSLFVPNTQESCKAACAVYRRAINTIDYVSRATEYGTTNGELGDWQYVSTCVSPAFSNTGFNRIEDGKRCMEKCDVAFGSQNVAPDNAPDLDAVAIPFNITTECGYQYLFTRPYIIPAWMESEILPSLQTFAQA